jgi:UDP-N-acetylmuramoyl-L-alanyl-D-glutamate--2,6-diaminopimelate ligase
MRKALEAGARWAVIEVSSHGLAMGRVDPAEFDIAVVTNVTRDHFDFHKTYEAYWEAKAKLVRGLTAERKEGRPKAAILNRDEEAVMAMAEGRHAPVLTYGLHPEADVRATHVEVTLDGCKFLLHVPGADPEPCHLQMLGEHNVSNALAAAAVGHVLGFAPATIARALFRCPGVPGRLERIEEGQDFHVFVDYAHNPAGLAQIVKFHPPGTGRLILLFGAEGGKDKGKRAQMGEIARQADVIILAGDNQWAESPEEVTAQVAAGLGDRPFQLILDRREAFRAAVREARYGDLLIICGRGHERILPLPGQVLEFDDREVIREVLREELGNRPDESRRYRRGPSEFDLQSVTEQATLEPSQQLNPQGSWTQSRP